MLKPTSEAPALPVRTGAGIAVVQHQQHVGAATGVSAARLEGITLVLADLPGSLLALTAGPAITLDRDAGGWGWFTDTSLASHTQFEDGHALAGSPAADRIDLLTVLVHELGHVLGLDHDHDSFGVMHEGLARERVSPAEDPPEASFQPAPARPPVSDEPAMVSAATLLDAAVAGDASSTVRAHEQAAPSDPARPRATSAPAAPTSSGGTSDAEQDVDLGDTPPRRARTGPTAWRLQGPTRPPRSPSTGRPRAARHRPARCRSSPPRAAG